MSCIRFSSEGQVMTVEPTVAAVLFKEGFPGSSLYQIGTQS